MTGHSRKPRHRDPYKKILRHFFTGVRDTFFIWVLFLLLEQIHLPWFEWLRWQVLRGVESSANSLASKTNAVVVVDISNELKSSSNEFTSRTELEKLLTYLTCNDKEEKERVEQISCTEVPSVIGVDIDFSPEPSQRDWHFVDPESDPHFFRFCKLRNVKIFLGVQRTIDRPYEYWLGLPEFKGLAAALPLQEEKTSEALVTGLEAPTFASVLASTYLLKTGAYPTDANNGILHFFLELDSETEAEGVREALIDYSTIDKIEKAKVDYKCIKENCPKLKEKFKDKVVIIGDARLNRKQLEDKFVIPRKGQEEPGVLVHAAVVDTLIHPERRLWKLRPQWDVTADLILSGSIILGLTYFFYRYHIEPSEKVFSSLFFVVSLVLLYLGFVMFQRHVVWDGCLIVAIALTFHSVKPLAAEKLGDLLEKLRHGTS